MIKVLRFALLSAMFFAQNAFSVVLTIPVADDLKVYIPLPSATVDTFEISASYHRDFAPPYDGVPALTSNTPVYIKILVPPGVSMVVASGESGSFSDQYFSSFDLDVTSQPCSLLSCVGKVMERINGALSATIYRGDVMYSPRYMTLALLNQASNFAFSSFKISMLVSDPTAYNNWRSARPWAGGLPANSKDGVGETFAGSGLAPCLAPPYAVVDSVGGGFVVTIDGLKSNIPGIQESMAVKLKSAGTLPDGKLVFTLDLGSDLQWKGCK